MDSEIFILSVFSRQSEKWPKKSSKYLKFTFFRCPWIYHARTSPGKCLHFDKFAIWQQMDLCVPFTIDLFLWHEIVVLPNQQEVVKNNTICSSLQKKLGKKRFGAKNAQNQRLHYINTTGMFLLQWVCFILILWNIQFWAFFAPNKKWVSDLRENIARYCVFLWWKNTFWTVLP